MTNISTRQHPVKDDPTAVKQLGLKALCESMSSDQKKTSRVKVNNFHTQYTKSKKANGKTLAPGKSNEVTGNMSMTQIIANDGELDLVDFIGNHECSDPSPHPSSRKMSG